MTIKELYILANETEQKVVAQITDDQWGLVMPVPKRSYWRWLDESNNKKYGYFCSTHRKGEVITLLSQMATYTYSSE